MKEKFFLFFLVLILISTLNLVLRYNKSMAQTNVAPKTLVITENFKLTGKTSKILFTMLLPRSIVNRQKILTINSSLPYKQTYYKNGNRYAYYEFINPTSDFSLVVTCTALLYSNDLDNARKTNAHDFSDTSTFLASEQYIESNDPKIQYVANAINGNNEIDTIHNIYDFVLSNLQYGGYNPGNVGAATALTKRTGDCTEYSDLLVALFRAKKIPARAVTGFTTKYYNTPKHSWVEVYTKKYGWITLDPTMGDSGGNTFDKIEPKYVVLSYLRNDPTLGGYSFCYLWYYGNPVKIVDTYSAY